MAANSPLLVYPKADLSLATLAPCTISAAGVWTVGTPVSLLGYLDSIAFSIDRMLLEAISVDAGYINRLQGPIDASAVVIENLKRSQSTSDNPESEIIVQGYDAARLQWQYATSATHAALYTIHGLWSKFTGGIQGVGGQKVGMSLQLTDTSYSSGIAPVSVVRV